MLGIVDYGMGNLGSVSNACAWLEIPARLIESPDELDDCSGLILPGQGAFGDCMLNLRAAGFETPLREWIAADKPFLGVCIGLQVLFEGSLESPDIPGLGMLPGQLDKFPAKGDRKVPQMGWNQMKLLRPDCPLFADVPDAAWFYFVHSYYVPAPPDADWLCGSAWYGFDYTAALWRGRLFATQYHPEKSQAVGKKLLTNFYLSTEPLLDAS